ncbi:MAG: hypothetical protein ACUVWP_07945 [bacterium]
MVRIILFTLSMFLIVFCVISCSSNSGILTDNTGVQTDDRTFTDYSISGLVTKLVNGEPIEDAHVLIEYTEGLTHICSEDYTDSSGYFYCSMEGHVHNAVVTFIVIPPESSGCIPLIELLYYGEEEPTLWVEAPCRPPWEDPPN